MNWSIFLLAFLAGTALAQSPASRAFTLADWYRVTTVRQPAMSPDGRWIAFTVTTVRESEIFAQPVNGGARRQLTWTSYSHRNEVASPDGQWIAFVADAAMRTDSAIAVREVISGSAHS